MKFELRTTALAIALSFVAAGAASTEKAPAPDRAVATLQSRGDGAGTTTYWGDGASFEIVGPGVTVFLLKERRRLRVNG